MMSFRAYFPGRLILGIAASAQLAIAHPNHDAIAEADWNADSRSLEVALQVNAHELERAVSLAAGKALDLDDAASSDHLKAYVVKNVRCLKSDGSAVEMRWVGAEIKVRSAWLYFEFPLGSDSGLAFADCSLSNTMFFDRYDDQKNTVALRLDPAAARIFLRFSKHQPVAKVRTSEDEEDTPALRSKTKESITKP